MKKITALDIIRKIMLEIECPLPSVGIMLSELKMMKFKMRPLAGDISSLSKMNSDVISSLWRIGRIDEIVQTHFYDLEEDGQEMVLKYLESFETLTQHQIKGALQAKKIRGKDVLKIEVYREFSSQDEVVN